MPRITLRYEHNKNVSFIHVINCLVSYEIMTLEEAVPLYKQFKLGEDVVLDVSDKLISIVGNHLDYLDCKYEITAR